MFSSFSFLLPLHPFLLMFLRAYLKLEKGVLVISLELFVLEYAFVIVISDFVKIIHVQLTNKRRKISMTKMDWKHLLFESLDIDNDKISSFFVPGDNILVNVVLNRNGNYLQDLVSL